MLTAKLILAIVILLVVIGALWLRSKTRKPSGGNAANTDPELESRYSLLGDNSGRMESKGEKNV